MNTVSVSPDLLRWACERSGKDEASLSARFPKLSLWETGEASPTLKQLEDFARATHTPVGYLFLSEPPVERIPIPDFRTVRDERIGRPSPDLLDTLYACQQRQEWYRDFARSMGAPSLSFVGSVQTTNDIVRTAANMRHAFGFDIEERRTTPTWTEALRRFIEQVDEFGVLVMVTSVVGSNNRRKLDPREFRGFALSDELAPLVFINGADTKAAQMFTLAHELAHIWLGQSALSDAGPYAVPDHQVESWCNRVAAELLAPLQRVKDEFKQRVPLSDEMARLARLFKVSTLVVLRRIHDAGFLSRDRFWQAYNDELQRLQATPRGSGGDFYLTQSVRLGKRFARAIIMSTLEGRNSFTEAFRLLGVKKMSTFNDFGHSLGVIM